MSARSNICAVAALAAGLVAYVSPLSAAPGKRSSPEDDQQVAAALELEAAGDVEDRAVLLSDVVARSPQHAASRWQTGHVLAAGHRWVSIDDMPALVAQDRNRRAYESRRSKAADTVEDQLALADWCHRRHLADEERAHLTRVVALDTDHAEARQRLGFVLVDGQWLAPEEIASSRQRAIRAESDLAAWRPKLEELLKDLTSDNARTRDRAEAELAAIDNPACVLALEAVLLPRSEPIARLALEKLAELPGYEASIALARQAVQSPFESIRAEAALLLADRPQDHYVPVLLAALVTPLEATSQVYRTPDGRLVHRLAYYRERESRGELAILDTSYGRIGMLPSMPSGAVGRADDDAEDTARELGQRAAAENARTDEVNRTVCATLAIATGHTAGRTPQEWWRWWNEVNEVFVMGSKPVVTMRTTRTVDVTRSSSGGGGGGGSGTADCLEAGTVVWTDAGPRPIESLRIGDRVLSQEVETGELAYKPVLATTIRPRSPLVRIETHDDALCASGGHPFWVSGRGWVKARELVPGDRLHDATGTTTVRSVVPHTEQQTYNLIVADFHTYFAGAGRVLSHDNTIRRQTNAVVPGLAGE
jgi:hypothetical protein